MLCEICWRMLRGQVGRQWRGTYDLHFEHHDSIEALRISHGMGCGICRVLYEELMAAAGKVFEPEYQTDHKEQAPEELEGDEGEVGPSAQSTALLGVVPDIEDDDVFRLDFKLEWAIGGQSPSVVKRTFVLKQTGKDSNSSSSNTSTLLNRGHREPDSPFQNSHVRGNILK
jgi:hypothetical protein